VRPRFEGDEEPRDTKGVGWLTDEKGRKYREEKGVRIYRTQEDRDSALDETYAISGVLRAALELDPGPVKQVASMVCMNAVQLAELFWREAPVTGGTNPRSKFEEWCARHFGRQLEFAAKGVLWTEVEARMAGASTRTLALYDSWGEQQRFERAARDVGPWKGGDEEAALEHAERIVEKATGKRVDVARIGPLLSEKAWQKRKALLLRQARDLELVKPEETPA
jgi:hypothetical protein